MGNRFSRRQGAAGISTEAAPTEQTVEVGTAPQQQQAEVPPAEKPAAEPLDEPVAQSAAPVTLAPALAVDPEPVAPVQPEPEPVQVAPEPVQEAVPLTEPEAIPDSVPEPVPEPTLVTESEPTPEAIEELEPVPDPVPEPTLVTESEPIEEFIPEPEPVAEAEPESLGPEDLLPEHVDASFTPAADSTVSDLADLLSGADIGDHLDPEMPTGDLLGDGQPDANEAEEPVEMEGEVAEPFVCDVNSKVMDSGFSQQIEVTGSDLLNEAHS